MTLVFLEIVYGNSNAYVQLDNLEIVFCSILAILKLLCFRIYANNLIRNFSSAVKDYLAMDTEEKRTIMRRHAYLGRVICYSVLSLSYLATLLFMLMALIADNEEVQINVTISQIDELPVPLTFLGEVYMSTTVYLLVSTLQYIVLTLTVTSNCGNDSLIFGIILHICGQIEILKIEFTKYDVNDKNKDFSTLASRHYYLIEHAEFIVDVISVVLLLQMLFSCLFVSLMGFQFILALKTNDAGMIVKTLSVLSALMLQLLFYSIIGDYLKCQMEDIAHSIYSCNWYDFPVKLMRNVLFVTMRSQQPVQLLAGRFFTVDVKSYMVIVKSAMSYISVLRVMVDE
ncbi:hypothetical protein PUN28_001865 [Cardiocondyla obscurior]